MSRARDSRHVIQGLFRTSFRLVLKARVVLFIIASNLRSLKDKV
jgi:hypothetical protein